jgi:hypothetical protein
VGRELVRRASFSVDCPDMHVPINATGIECHATAVGREARRALPATGAMGQLVGPGSVCRNGRAVSVGSDLMLIENFQ